VVALSELLSRPFRRVFFSYYKHASTSLAMLNSCFSKTPSSFVHTDVETSGPSPRPLRGGTDALLYIQQTHSRHTTTSSSRASRRMMMVDSQSTHLNAQVQHARCHVLVHLDLDPDAPRGRRCVQHMTPIRHSVPTAEDASDTHRRRYRPSWAVRSGCT